MKAKWLTLTTGLALFSMFFGSGNLVFPIAVGQESDGHYLLASLGIISTGVIVPFLGVIGMMLYKGNIEHFFKCFGNRGMFIFSLLTLGLMGPFGVLARCLTVAHGALLLLFPQLSLPLTSFVLCLVTYFFAVNKSKIVTILGNFLTPFLLISIAAIAYFGLKQDQEAVATFSVGWDALKNGFLQGCQTMDLLAAFFFSKFVIDHLYENISDANESTLLKIFFKASLVGALLLSVIYLALVSLGWSYSALLENTPPQEMLGKIALASLGSMAAPCVCFAVIVTCMTTAIVLASLFAEFLRQEVTKEKLNSSQALIVTLMIGFCVSTLDFGGIAAFLGPLLELVYPALITLTVINIINKFVGFKASHWPFTLTIAAKLCWF